MYSYLSNSLNEISSKHSINVLYELIEFFGWSYWVVSGLNKFRHTQNAALTVSNCDIELMSSKVVLFANKGVMYSV